MKANNVFIYLASKVASRFANIKVNNIACLLVLLVPLFVSCKSSKMVENTRSVNVLQQQTKQSVSVKDSGNVAVVVASADSNRVGEQLRDSIHDQDSVYIHEVTELDGNGKIIKRTIDKTSTHKKDRFAVNSTQKNHSSANQQQRNDSQVSVAALNIDSILAKTDSISASKVMQKQRQKHDFFWWIGMIEIVFFVVVVIVCLVCKLWQRYIRKL
jgi:uncharacterized membrane protein YdfJ with MMPL/SSD domain